MTLLHGFHHFATFVICWRGIESKTTYACNVVVVPVLLSVVLNVSTGLAMVSNTFVRDYLCFLISLCFKV